MSFIKNGYIFSTLLRKTRRRYGLSASSQALYHELVAIANEEGWPDTFKCSAGELESSLSISENTLKTVRNELIQCGLIVYKSGKVKRQFSEYGLLVSNFDTQADTNPATEQGTNTGTKPGTEPADYNKLKDKLNKLIVEQPALIDFFRQTSICRLLVEQYRIDLTEKVNIFYLEKNDLGELKNKTKEDLLKNFRNWLPIHVRIQKEEKEKSSGKKENKLDRGLGLGIEKFTNNKMRQ